MASAVGLLPGSRARCAENQANRSSTRGGFVLADGAADVGRLAAQFRLDRVEGGNPLQRLGGDRRGLALG